MDKKLKSCIENIHAEDALVNSTMEYINKHKKQSRTAWLAPAICVAVLALLVFGGVKVYALPVSTISVDGTTPTTIKVNIFNRVIYAEDENGSQKDALNNMSYTEAVETIIEKAEAEGELQNDIVITVESSSPEKSDSITSDIEELDCVKQKRARVRLGHSSDSSGNDDNGNAGNGNGYGKSNENGNGNGKQYRRGN